VLTVLLSAIAPGYAQSPAAPVSTAPLPSPGFVPPYEIMRTVRAAGFDPLAPPLREGATYVLRATDFNGILMRVVVDARTGAIRDANRIVSGPGNYGSGGQFGLAVPDAEPGMLPEPLRLPPDLDVPVMSPAAQTSPALQPPPKRHDRHVATARSRPAKLAVHKPGGDAKPAGVGNRTQSFNTGAVNTGGVNTGAEHTGAEVTPPIGPAAKPGRAPSAIND
jgi:hypothetical protein